MKMESDTAAAIMTQEDLEKCRQLGASEERIKFASGLSRAMRDQWFRGAFNLERNAEEKAARELAELEAISRGELTPAMEQQQKQQEILRQIQAEAQKQHRRKVAEKYADKAALGRAGMPPAFQHTDMDYVLRRGVPEHLEYSCQRVSSFIENIDACLEKGTGLVIAGPVGTLKTTMASAILLAGFRKGIEGYFALVTELLERLVYLERNNQQEYHHIMEMLCHVPLLVLDDMGAEGKRAKFISAKLEQIILRRHASLLPVIITTNSTDRELTDLYSDRVLDRLAERCYVIHMTGASNRRPA